MKNRLAHIRRWAIKIHKENVVPRDSAALGVDSRTHVTNINKSVALDQRLDLIQDPRMKISLELQRPFGLHREESIKLSPLYADRGDRLVLKDPWAKGGRAREISICTAHQRAVLDRAHEIARTLLCTTPQGLRTQSTRCRVLQAARAAPCLCPRAVSGIDGPRRAGCRRSPVVAIEPGRKA